MNDKVHFVKWYYRAVHPEDPHISLKDHPEGELYAEASSVGHVQDLQRAEVKGANVFIGKRGECYFKSMSQAVALNKFNR